MQVVTWRQEPFSTGIRRCELPEHRVYGRRQSTDPGTGRANSRGSRRADGQDAGSDPERERLAREAAVYTEDAGRVGTLACLTPCAAPPAGTVATRAETPLSATAGQRV